MYQMMFAIITPALIVGAIAERMKFSSVMLFVALWMFFVYFPLAHMVWGVDGFMNGVWNADATIKAIDFAGGTVVHMSSGWSALVLCILLGKRRVSARLPARTAWCSPWSARACCGSAGTALTPAARSPPTPSLPTPSSTTTAAAVAATAAHDHHQRGVKGGQAGHGREHQLQLIGGRFVPLVG